MERNTLINVRVSPEELAGLKASAGEYDMTVSDYIRAVASGSITVHDDYPELVPEIIRCLSLLRYTGEQLFNLGKDSSNPEMFRQFHDCLCSVIDPLISKLQDITS